MPMPKPLHVAVAVAITGAAATFAVASAEPQRAPPSSTQGWGLAISYEVIGEKCAGALSSDDMEIIRRFVAEGLAQTKSVGGAFDAEQFARSFRAEMVDRYSEPGNCTDAAIKGARNAVATLRERGAAKP